MTKSRFLGLFSGVLLLALLSACSGGGDDSGSASEGSATSIQSVNILNSTAKLSELKSFTFDMSIKFDLGDAPSASGEDDPFSAMLMALLGDIRAEGAYMAPDKIRFMATIGGMEVGYVQIGDKAWEKSFGPWTETTADDSLIDLTGGDPATMFSDFLPDEAIKVAKVTKEKVNGVDATRYSFDKAALEEMLTQAGEDTSDFAEVTSANLDMWVNDDGVPVRVLLKFGGKDESGADVGIEMEMNVRDINSNSIKIEAPI